MSDSVPMGTRHAIRRTLVGLALAFAPVFVAQGGETKPDAAKAEFFETKVRPVLANRCFECHGAKKQKGGLRLDSAEAVRAGGDSGPAVVPGDADQSLLVEAINYRDDSIVQMPPKGKLDETEIAALTEWVKLGAPWPSASAEVRTANADTSRGKEITEADRAFWSFQPVKAVAPPAVKTTDWARSAIDRFILAKLEEKGLAPSPPADRRTLVRRATFDLIGLPPTPEEVEAFVADDSADAFAKVVDRLLASPHYGERWARHWLDVARYGEDQAHSFKPRLYPNGYLYRDWLVKAFNEDLPYDKFVEAQIAGDLLGEPGKLDRLPALGFFALGPVYYGDPKKFDQIDDRIDTMSRGFLGLTVACARCHDHKYDPIPTADYYALAGVFASSEYEEAAFAKPEEIAAYDKAQEAIKAKNDEMDALIKAETSRLVHERADSVAAYMTAAWETSARKAYGLPDAKPEQVAKQAKLDPMTLRKWIAYLEAEQTKDKSRELLARWDAAAKRSLESPDLLADEATRTELKAAAVEVQARLQTVVAKRAGADEKPAVAKAGGTGGGASDEKKNASTSDKADTALYDDLFGEKGFLAAPKEKVMRNLAGEPAKKLDTMRKQMDELKKHAPEKYPVAHTLKDGSPKSMNILVRGNPESPGAEVSRHFLSILGDAAPFKQGSGRLELAQAIASAKNPLTARVFVNRVWQHHFGRGLVGTPSNFGALGERPTHPELLDHLASQFVAEGWSIKKLHRAILLSAVYQQASQADTSKEEVDPENHLLWRMNRKRLEVEAWRDAMLAASGKLDLTLGGPPLRLEDNANHRRTLYASVSRHDLSPILRLFDFPDPNITSGERSRTTVPLQQLLVLNSELLIGNARALAARLKNVDGDDAARIQKACLLCYGRPASEQEVKLGLEYLQAQDEPAAAKSDLSRWERYAQILLGANEFAFVD